MKNHLAYDSKGELPTYNLHFFLFGVQLFITSDIDPVRARCPVGIQHAVIVLFTTAVEPLTHLGTAVAKLQSGNMSICSTYL